MCVCVPLLSFHPPTFSDDLVDTNRRGTFGGPKSMSARRRGTVREKVFIGALSARRLDYPAQGRRRRRRHEKYQENSGGEGEKKIFRFDVHC